MQNITVTAHTDPNAAHLFGSVYTFPDGWKVFDVESARHQAWLYFFKPEEVEITTKGGWSPTAYLLRKDGSARFVECDKQADEHLAALAAQYTRFQKLLQARNSDKR